MITKQQLKLLPVQRGVTQFIPVKTVDIPIQITMWERPAINIRKRLLLQPVFPEDIQKISVMSVEMSMYLIIRVQQAIHINAR